jgi:hypothetical protein
MNNISRIAFSIILKLLILASFNNAYAAQRHALLVGMNNYNEVFEPLSQPSHDVVAMKSILNKIAPDISVVDVTDLRRREFDEILSSFLSSINRGDSVILYLSGHGVQVQNRTYIIPIGGHYGTVPDIVHEINGALDVSLIIDKIHDRIGNSGSQVAIIDACRNVFYKSRGDTGRLGSVHANGVYIGYSSSPKQRSWAHGPGDSKLSMYTHVLLEKIKEDPGADIRNILNDVTRTVYDNTNGEQWPWVSGNMLYDFCLTGSCTSLPRTSSMTESRLMPSASIPTRLIYEDDTNNSTKIHSSQKIVNDTLSELESKADLLRKRINDSR